MDTAKYRKSKFEYIQPAGLVQAIQLLSNQDQTNKILAGGTDLLPFMRRNKPAFDRMIDISRLPELKRIERKDQTIFLGAGVTYIEVIENELLQEVTPFLIEMCQQVGSPQIRNVGTIGGNVINAAICADSLPVLVCLDAIAHLRSSDGEREIPITEFVTGPNSTLIKQGELLTNFSFTIPPKRVKTKFLKLARGGISRLSMAVMGGVDENGIINFVRITPGSITPRVMRFIETENILLGQCPTPELKGKASLQVAEKMIAITGRRWSTEYKEGAVVVMTERALQFVF